MERHITFSIYRKDDSEVFRKLYESDKIRYDDKKKSIQDFILKNYIKKLNDDQFRNGIFKCVVMTGSFELTSFTYKY